MSDPSSPNGSATGRAGAGADAEAPAERGAPGARPGEPPATPAPAAEPAAPPALPPPGPRLTALPPPPAERMAVELPKAVAPRPLPRTDGSLPLDHPSLYFNRELGDIDFNWRVLYQAMDARVPLLERVRYLAITASNLDEFFQKRVGGLKRQQAAGVLESSPDGRLPGEQLRLIRDATRELHRHLDEEWLERVCPALADIGVRVVGFGDLDEAERARVAAHFRSDIYPIVTPLAVDSGRPFPLISNLSLSLAVTLTPAAEADADTGAPPAGRRGELFVRLKVPTSTGRLFALGGGRFLPLELILRHHIAAFFPGMAVSGAWVFRVTRNADVRFDEEEADDLIAAIAEELRERRFAPVVRLEVEAGMPQRVRSYLMRHLDITADDVFETRSLLGVAELSSLADLDLPEHRFEPWRGVTARRIALHQRTAGHADAPASLFELIRAGDVLVHHPYDLFASSVQRFVEEAADDPRVLAIKQTLYRTSDDSPIVAALTRAAERGKQVAVLVEVKARFDEANNIEWGERLEAAGVHVSYGFVGLKIHTKLILVVRREPQGIRTYCHIGTGNYNTTTAQLYTDLGLLTSDPVLGEDLVNLFHHITGYAPEQHYRQLVVAPWAMRERFIALVEREVEHARAGREARIVAKMNGLDDLPLIQALYRASQAGVRSDLLVRGHSRLRPGLPGYSEHIRVMSIIGRFLEHDRLFYFHNGGDPELFLGSADWKRRNLSDRIEAVTPVHDPALRGRLVDILERALLDNRLAWDLQPDGRYLQRRPADGEPERALQQQLMAKAREAER